MFAKLLTLLSAVGVISLNAPIMVEKTIQYDSNDSVLKRNYRHDEYVDTYTKVTYKYDTNDVLSVDDLVVGNIYHFADTIPVSTNTLPLSDFYNLEVVTNNNDYQSIISCSSLFSLSYNVNYVTIRYLENTNLFTLGKSIIGDFQTIDFDFICSEETLLVNNYYVSRITRSDFNIIESVTYEQPTTIIGYINEFLDNNLFSEIPYVRDITFNIGGEDINLLTWLIMLTGIIACGGFLFLMIKLFIWLFKIVSNSILLR